MARLGRRARRVAPARRGPGRRRVPHGRGAHARRPRGRHRFRHPALRRRRRAKRLVGGLIESIPGMRWVDAGPLANARITEPLTALVITINRRYKLRDGGFRITGRDSWGVPGVTCPGRLVPIDDTALWVVERGPDDGLPLLVLHGGRGSITTSSPTTSTPSPRAASGSCSSTSGRAAGRAALAADLDARAVRTGRDHAGPLAGPRPVRRAGAFLRRVRGAAARSTTRAWRRRW